jgi:hypothetical protein
MPLLYTCTTLILLRRGKERHRRGAGEVLKVGENGTRQNKEKKEKKSSEF